MSPQLCQRTCITSQTYSKCKIVWRDVSQQSLIFALCASVNMQKLIFSAEQSSTSWFSSWMATTEWENNEKTLFSNPDLAEMSFCWLPQIPAQPRGTLTWSILRVCVLILGSGSPVRSSVLVTASYSFGGTGISYASAQMTWLKEHMGDKNPDSCASFYLQV